MKTISFRTETERVVELDELASRQHRDRTFVINEALDQYLDLQRSHREQIERGLADFEAGRTRPHAEVMALVEGWREPK